MLGYLKVKYVILLIDLYCLLVVTLHYAEIVCGFASNAS
jgi:hypothetical protein